MNRARPGVQPLGNGPQSTYGDAAALWNEALDAKLRTGKSKPDAVRELAVERPDLHQQYIAEHNARAGPSSYRGSTLD